MADENPIRRVSGMRPVGIADQGETAIFELALATGEIIQLGTPTSTLHLIVSAMRHLATTAEGHKQGLPTDFLRDEVATPYRLRGIATGAATDGSLVVRLETTQGIPLVVAMSVDQAKELRTKLRREAENLPKSRIGH